MADLNNRVHNHERLKDRRRELRNAATPAEATLWKYLQRSQLDGRKFRRQHSVGPYVLDFYCPVEKLAVELDGEPHRDPFRHGYDSKRAAFLQSEGIRVLRIENREVFERPEIVLQKIAWYFGH